MNIPNNEIPLHHSQRTGGSHRLTCQIALLATLLLFGLTDAAVILLVAGVAGTGQIFAFTAAFIMIAVWTLLSCFLLESMGSKPMKHAIALFCDTGSALLSSDRQPDEAFYTHSVPTPQ